jgi:hypothetical protein
MFRKGCAGRLVWEDEMPDRRTASDADDLKEEIEQARRALAGRITAALANLEGKADFPEARVRVRRLKRLLVWAFLEIDELWRLAEALSALPGRSPLHQQAIQERLGWLLSEVEQAIKELIVVEIDSIKTSKPPEPLREQVIETVEVPPAWWKWLREHAPLVWIAGIIVLLLLLIAVC